MRQYASPRDRLAEVRTKLPPETYDEIQETANRLDLSMYETVRVLLIWALNNHPMRSIGTGTQNSGPARNFGNPEQVLQGTHEGTRMERTENQATDGTTPEAAPAAANGRDSPA